jgi:hypothetical protein
VRIECLDRCGITVGDVGHGRVRMAGRPLDKMRRLGTTRHRRAYILEYARWEGFGIRSTTALPMKLVGGTEPGARSFA